MTLKPVLLVLLSAAGIFGYVAHAPLTAFMDPRLPERPTAADRAAPESRSMSPRAADLPQPAGNPLADIVLDLPAPLLTAAQEGHGFDTFGGTLKQPCIDTAALVIVDKGGGFQGFEIAESSNRNNFAQALKLNIKAAAGFGPWKATTRYRLFKGSVYEANSRSVAISARVTLPTRALSKRKLSPIGITAATASAGETPEMTAARFIQTCGTHFVGGKVIGQEVNAVATEASDELVAYSGKKKDLKLRLSVFLDAAVAHSATVEQKKAVIDTKMRIDKSGGLQAFPSIDELVAMVQNLPVAVKNDSGNVPLSLVLMSYDQVAGRPSKFVDEVVKLSAASVREERYAALALDAEERATRLQQVIDNYADFSQLGYTLLQQRATPRAVLLATARRDSLNAMIARCEISLTQCPDEKVLATIPSLPLFPERPSNAWAPPIEVRVDPASPTWQFVGSVPFNSRGVVTARGLWAGIATAGIWAPPTPSNSMSPNALFPDQRVGGLLIQGRIRATEDRPEAIEFTSGWGVGSPETYDIKPGIDVYVMVNDLPGSYPANKAHHLNPMTVTLNKK